MLQGTLIQASMGKIMRLRGLQRTLGQGEVQLNGGVPELGTPTTAPIP